MAEARPAPLDPRKAAILTAVVREYVQTAEPVPSKRIVDTYELGVSAATVRNEMAALEDAGYIAQPHTSAGRVPTDKGYRYFVDSIDEVRPLHETQRLALHGFIKEAHDLEDLLRRTTQVLAQLTRYASLVVAPALDRSRLKLIELVGLGPQTALVLLIADTGRVEKRQIELSTPITEVDLQRVRTLLNETAAGLRMADVPGVVAGISDAVPADLRDIVAAVTDAIDSDLARASIDRVFVSGQASLAAETSFEADELQLVFELLEEQTTLGQLLVESPHSDRPIVRIGEENRPIEGLRVASIVAAAYGEDAPGGLGVLGPTRMDYPAVLAAVHAVANQLQEALTSLQSEGPHEASGAVDG